MGIFTANRSQSLGGVHVEAAQGYNKGTLSLAVAMVEAHEANGKMIRDAIIGDIQESALVLEQAGSDRVQAMQEANAASFWERIKEFVRNLIAKIKAVFRGFMAKLNSYVMKDNRAFFDKYKADVAVKNLSKMKAKVEKPKGSSMLFLFPIGLINVKDTVARLEEAKKYIEEKDHDERVLELLAGCTPSVKADSLSEYSKEVHSALFEDEDEVEGLKGLYDSYVMPVLSNKDDIVKKAEAGAKSLESALETMLKQIETAQAAVLKDIPDSSKAKDRQFQGTFGLEKDSEKKPFKATKGEKTGYGATDDYNKSVVSHSEALNLIHTHVQDVQAAANKFSAACIQETKFYVSQARRLYAAMVAYRPVKEGAEDVADFMQYVQEAEMYDAEVALS